eukprot:COSAG06_NODE_7329_length_2544_cov_8.932106_4_plen_143_part_00
MLRWHDPLTSPGLLLLSRLYSQVYITEYSVSVGETQVDHDTSNAAAFVTRLIGELDGVVDILSYWAFSVRLVCMPPLTMCVTLADLRPCLICRIFLKKSACHKESLRATTDWKRCTVCAHKTASCLCHERTFRIDRGRLRTA